MIGYASNQKALGNPQRRKIMELAPKTAVQIFFVILVAVIFIAFGKTYSNSTVENTTTTSNSLWSDVGGKTTPGA